MSLPKPTKSSSPWVRAFVWLEAIHPVYGHEPGFRFLHGMASKRAAKRLKPTFAPKIQAIPKRMLQKDRKKALRGECEALCKAIVKLRDCKAMWGPCISCGVSHYRQTLQWGHFIAQNDSKWLQYDTRNTGMQCGRCNGLMQGNYREYRAAIERREPGLASKLEAEAIQYKNWKQDAYQLELKKSQLMAEAVSVGIDPDSVLKK